MFNKEIQVRAAVQYGIARFIYSIIRKKYDENQYQVLMRLINSYITETGIIIEPSVKDYTLSVEISYERLIQLQGILVSLVTPNHTDIKVLIGYINGIVKTYKEIKNDRCKDNRV